MMKMNILNLFSVCAVLPFICGDICKSGPKCMISRIQGMRSADCFDKNLRKISQCFSSDMEVLDFSKNRIRRISRNDLQKYSNLKVLYLQDNMIMSIDEDAFAGQDYLTALDLSVNALSDLPAVILNLPSLKTLYLGQNWNMNIAEVVEKAKIITSPLSLLDLSSSSTEDEFIELPDLRSMPYLIKYNISGNNLKNLSTRPFAGLCKLEILVTENTTAQFSTPCSCWVVNRWLVQRRISFSLFKCSISENDCTNEKVNEEDLQIYDSCKVEAAEIKKGQLTKKYLYISAGIVIALLAIVAISLFMRRRHNNNHRKPEADQMYHSVQHSENPKDFVKQ